MQIDEFRTAQRERTAQNLHALYMACRRKFLAAARLLELQTDAIESLGKHGSGTVELSPLGNL